MKTIQYDGSSPPPREDILRMKFGIILFTFYASINPASYADCNENKLK